MIGHIICRKKLINLLILSQDVTFLHLIIKSTNKN